MGSSFLFCPIKELRLSVQDPVLKTPGFISTKVYEPSSKNERDSERTILLLPPTGGENILDRGTANILCSSGFRVVLIQTWFGQTEKKLDLVMHDEGALRSLAAIRHVIDWLRPKRSSQVGILGTSVGALSSALALGFDPRLNTGVLIAGGVGMPEIIAESTEEGVSSLREARKRAFGYKDNQEYLADLQRNVKIEPADFSSFSGPKNVLAFVGLQDTTVPTPNQKSLVKIFSAEFDEFRGDHLSTIKNTFFWKQGKIVDFFRSHLY